jgi:hypothetical protein
MRRRTTLNAAIILMAGALLTIVVPAAAPMAEAQDTPKEVYEPAQALPAEAYAPKAGAAYAIGMLAYIWGYPLMDMYRLRDYIPPNSATPPDQRRPTVPDTVRQCPACRTG